MGALLLLSKRVDIKSLVIVFLLLLSSLLTRESGILFITTIFFYGLFSSKKHIIHYVTVLISTIGVYTLLRFGIANVHYFKTIISPIMELPLSERLINTPKIIYFYLSTFIFPYKLSTSQQWVVKTLSYEDFYFPLVIVILFILIIVFFGRTIWAEDRRDVHIFTFFFLWFGFGLGVHLQIIPLDFTVTERWFYFPMVGLLGMLGVITKQYSLPQGYIRYFGIVFIVILLSLFSIRTLIRNTNWYDKMTLYSHDIKISKESFDLHTNLGVEYAKLKQYDKAQQHFETSRKIAPYNFVNNSNLGIDLL